jgi:hypothetical protein
MSEVVAALRGRQGSSGGIPALRLAEDVVGKGWDAGRECLEGITLRDLLHKLPNAARNGQAGDR